MVALLATGPLPALIYTRGATSLSSIIPKEEEVIVFQALQELLPSIIIIIITQRLIVYHYCPYDGLYHCYSSPSL